MYQNPEKNPDMTKKAVIAKNSIEPEYVCRVFFAYDPSGKNQRYAVEIETIKLFSVLNYNLSLKSSRSKNIIDVNILGLKATNNYTNEPGPAVSVVYFDELYGKHTINIIKQDGSVNSAVFNFNIFKKSIELVDVSIPAKKSNSRFCEFKVAEEKFTFA